MGQIQPVNAVFVVYKDAVEAQARALRTTFGTPLPPVDRAAHESAVAACRTQPGETAFAEVWAHAAAQPFQELVEAVLKPGSFVRRTLDGESDEALSY